MPDTYDPRHGDRVRMEGHGTNDRGEQRAYVFEGTVDRPYPGLPGWRLIGHNVLTGAEVDRWCSSDEQMNNPPGLGYEQTTRPI